MLLISWLNTLIFIRAHYKEYLIKGKSLHIAHHTTLPFSISGIFPVKTLLQNLTRKGPFSCIPARSHKIPQDIATFCRNLAEILCKIPAKSHKIPQDLAGSCKILQVCKKKGPILARCCRSVFTGLFKQRTLISH